MVPERKTGSAVTIRVKVPETNMFVPERRTWMFSVDAPRSSSQVTPEPLVIARMGGIELDVKATPEAASIFRWTMARAFVRRRAQDAKRWLTMRLVIIAAPKIRQSAAANMTSRREKPPQEDGCPSFIFRDFRS